jgi:hypothetical protein
LHRAAFAACSGNVTVMKRIIETQLPLGKRCLFAHPDL